MNQSRISSPHAFVVAVSMMMIFAWVVIGPLQKSWAGMKLMKQKDKEFCKGAVFDNNSAGSRAKSGTNDHTLYHGQ